MPSLSPINTLLVLGGIVITVQGFGTVHFLGDQYDALTRVRASRLAQLISSVIYIGFVAVATPVMGLGTSAGADGSLLDIIGRIAPWLAVPLVLSAVLSQFSAAIASRAFAAYYAIQAVIALRTSTGLLRKTGFGALALLMLVVVVFALPAS